MPDPNLTDKNVICLGSYSMRHSAKKNGWTPGVFDLEPFDFTEQLKHWGTHMLNSACVVKPFSEITLSDFIDENESGEGVNVHRRFLRPIHDSKAFSGKVFDAEEFLEWKVKVCVLEQDFGNSALNKETLIQVCPLQKIFSEHRFWVVKGNIVTSSTYKLGNTVIYQSLPHDNMYEKFAQERIAEWQPHEAFVIDVADTENGLKIVEINTLNSCGFYAANLGKLIEALQDNFSTNCH